MAARRKRWDAASARYQQLREQARQARGWGEREDPAEREQAYRAVLAIADTRPAHPSWSGERIRAVSRRLSEQFEVDLGRIWPALWLTLPEAVRAEITTARTELTRATVLAGWAVLYASLAAWWWPAALVAAGLLLTARQRMRAAVDTYADLVEAASRLHAPALAEQLGLPQEGPLSPDTGRALTQHLAPGPARVPQQ